MSNRIAPLEGLLFVAGDEGLTIEQIAYCLDLLEIEVRELLEVLKDVYEQEDRGLRLQHLANTYKLTTKVEHHEYFERLISNPQSHKLSQAALETLAIIAYNQPITRMKIEQIRGVSADNMLRKLTAYSLIKDVGRSEGPGRPLLYAVTDEFLDYFNLSSLSELPDLSEVYEEDVLEEADLFLTKFREDLEEGGE